MNQLLSYLLTPSNTSIVAPPLDTKKQELPIEQLAWEDFERLCLRLVQTQFSLDDCELYGTKGQKQKGIDIFAKKPTGKYASYQCKRYESMTASTLNKLVEAFTEDEWAAKSDEFILCTTVALNTTDLQDTFNTLRDKLAAAGIAFIKWDKAQVQLLLKKHPSVVYDFFGKEWVRLFNGESALAQITTVKRLDNNLVIKYRQELHAFYSAVFNQYDPGLVIQELNSTPFLIQDRFILPDVYEEKGFVNHYELNKQAAQAPQPVAERARDMHTSRLLRGTGNISDNRANVDEFHRKSFKARIPFDVKLVQSKRNIVIGDPGAGKSTLLRYLALDLLSNSPVLSTVAQHLGTCLPIWLPFAYITKQLNTNENYSLADLLRTWFTGSDKAHLFELVQEALHDERLVLLIDGVDEWTSLAAAEQAIVKIEIQARLRSTTVIYSSRPYGYNLLKDSLLNLQPLELAPFSLPQQRAFVYNWYQRWLLAIEPSETGRAQTETDSFFAELDKSSDLKGLAENALLLSILVTQKLRDSVLPRNKLKALQDITDYLINKHPTKRRREAGIIEETRLDFELGDVFAELAFYIQQHSNDGTIGKGDAYKVVETYLTSLMGYEPARAKKVSKELIDLSANSIGIIIEKSNEEIAFRHRQFQEYLAAKYIYESDKAVAYELLRAHASEQTWNQVILAFFGLIPFKKTSDFTDYLTQVSYTGLDQAKEWYCKFLLYEISLKLPNSPLQLAKDALDRIQQEFELESDEAIKQILLQILLSAVENPKIKELVIHYFCGYFPNTFVYSDFRTQALRALKPEELSEKQKAFLLKSVLSGNTRTQLSASATLGMFMADEWVAEKVGALINRPSPPRISAFALNAMAGPATSPETKAAAIAQFAGQDRGTISLFVAKLKVALGTQTDEDLADLIKSGRNIDYELEDELVSVLATGWPTSQALLRTCLKAVAKNADRQGQKLHPKIAWKLLFHSFNKQKRVVDRMIKELETEEYPFIALDNFRGWQYIATYFKDDARLIPVIDRWLVKQEHNDPETAFASLVGRTTVARDYLLTKLKDAHFPHWPMMALVEGWGQDPGVQAQLKAYFRGNSTSKAYAAHYVSSVFRDEPAEGVAILQQLLFDRSISFRDRALSPLIELDRAYFERDLLTPFIENELALLPRDSFGQYESCLETLVEQFASNSRVKSLLFNEQNQQDATVASLIIRHYSSATSLVDQTLEHSKPLSVSYRLQMIERLGERYVVDKQSLDRLALFASESNDLLRCEAAIRYFKSIKDTEKDTIRTICTDLAFYRGLSHEANRQIAFIGFLILGELDKYFSLRDEYQQKKPSPEFSFVSSVRDHEPALIKAMAEYFDQLYVGIGGDFSAISRFLSSSSGLQDMWGAFAKYSTAASACFPYLLEFVEQHVDSIDNLAILELLAQATPGSSVLKRIALRLVLSHKTSESIYAGKLLGQQFGMDPDVLECVADITDYFSDSGKIMAVSVGWPALPVLKSIFDDVVRQRLSVNEYVGYQLKFMFRDCGNITQFLDSVLTELEEARYQHKYFITPLLARISRDEQLRKILLDILLGTERIAQKISFYALLVHANAGTPELAAWKDGQQAYLTSYGYNIVKNRTMSLSEAVHDIWY